MIVCSLSALAKVAFNCSNSLLNCCTSAEEAPAAAVLAEYEAAVELPAAEVVVLATFVVDVTVAVAATVGVSWCLINYRDVAYQSLLYLVELGLHIGSF